MRTVRSFVEDRWVEGAAPTTALRDPTSGEQVGTASSRGVDLASALRYARTVGGPALRALTFAERGALLEKLSKALYAERDALIEISRENAGTTRSDGKFDVDGAIGTLAYYAGVGAKLGDRRVLLDGEAEKLLRSARFVGQHVWVPRQGVAVHINAFNFPAWGMCEKLAVAFLAGVPVFSKPATSTAAPAARIVELWSEQGLLPPGSLALLVGSAGDLLDHVGPQDVVAFTGGSETAGIVRGHPNLVKHNVRVNIEADSLNAAVLGPDVEPGSDVFHMFCADVARDLTQKTGQKCTAIRRIFVPEALVDAVTEALVERLGSVRAGDPGEKGTNMGPLATDTQKKAIEAGLRALDGAASLVWRGTAPEGGCFVAAALYRSDRGLETPFVHEHEVFGPVGTLLTWPGDAAGAVALVAAGGGMLVSSVYSDDLAWAGEVVLGIAPFTGRIHWGSKKVHDQSPGPGTVLPNLVHGGPGKAGGGEELGGERGMQFYLQRTAIMADKSLLDRILG